MSETEINKGRLTPTNKTPQEYFKDTPKPDNFDPSDPDDWYDLAYDAGGVVIVNNLVYKDDPEDIDAYEDIAQATLNEDGTIDYLLKYYNGGASKQEVLEDAMRKLP